MIQLVILILFAYTSCIFICNLILLSSSFNIFIISSIISLYIKWNLMYYFPPLVLDCSWQKNIFKPFKNLSRLAVSINCNSGILTPTIFLSRATRYGRNQQLLLVLLTISIILITLVLNSYISFNQLVILKNKFQHATNLVIKFLI